MKKKQKAKNKYSLFSPFSLFSPLLFEFAFSFRL